MKPLQLEEGIKFLADLVRKSGAEAPIVTEDFNKEAGIGITVSEDEVVATIEAIFKEAEGLIKEQGNAFDFSKLIYKARDQLKWAD